MQTKTCATCKQDKPLSDFYLHKPSGKHEKRCKACKLERARELTKRTAVVSGVPHENLIIEELKKRGIYACSGKLSRARWVDIVAFGCVSIEAKLGKPHNKSGYMFSFTAKQVKELRGDILVFMINHGDGVIDYHLLRSNHPSLFHGDGTRKQWITYTPDCSHGNCDEEWADHMDNARGNWQLVLDILNEKIKALKEGKQVDKWTKGYVAR